MAAPAAPIMAVPAPAAAAMETPTSITADATTVKHSGPVSDPAEGTESQMLAHAASHATTTAAAVTAAAAPVQAQAAATETATSAVESALAAHAADQEIAALKEEFKGLELDGLVLQHFDTWRDAGECARPGGGGMVSAALGYVPPAPPHKLSRRTK
eukprot:121042-Prymnesium_polylepis.3